MTKKRFQDDKNKTVPWADSHYYLINGIKYAYETIAGLDFILLYDGMGCMYIGDVRAQGYLVTAPKATRKYVATVEKNGLPSAGHTRKGCTKFVQKLAA